jgi:hypothetical protein
VARDYSKITVLELFLYIWFAAFSYDELSEWIDAGSIFYTTDVWVRVSPLLSPRWLLKQAAEYFRYGHAAHRPRVFHITYVSLTDDLSVLR